MSTQDSSAAEPLPAGFTSIADIRNLPNEKLKAKVFVNLIGFVKDFMPPKATDGTSFICTIELLDHSIQHESSGIQMTFFWPKEKMPLISGPAEIVILRNAKAQMYKGAVSLITNWSTECHVLPSSKVSSSLLTHPTAPWQSFSTGKFKVPTLTETNYVIWAKGHIREIDIPSSHEFHEKSMQAMKVKDKFSLLKDVKPDQFYDILGQVVKVHDLVDVMSVYLSDYTTNGAFYNNAWGGEGELPEGQDGDEYGYTKPRSKDLKNWPGPFGKRCIQLNLYDEHASFMREYVKIEQWLLLSNVQIKYGKMGGLLEGYLRGDRQRYNGRVQVKIMEKSDEPEGNDARWIEGLKRSREYWDKHEIQKKALFREDSGSGNKRKAEDDGSSKLNSKQRRKEKRAAGEKKAADFDAKLAERLDLNDNVRCSFPDKAPISLKEITKPEVVVQPDGPGLPSPFTVRKYRSNVRIVNYAPERIEDFSVWRRESEYDILSDYSGGEDTDLEEDMRSYSSGKGFAKKIWEWRFWLQVEDASSSTNPTTPNTRIWLLVDNSAAQGLLGLDDDAANLRKDPNLLARLKEQLFKLWGDLEEQKSEALKLRSKKVEMPPPSSFASSTRSPSRNIGQQPDADSDAENEMPPPPSSKNKGEKSNADKSSDTLGVSPDGELNSLKPRNKAFTCCIQQYGIKANEDDPAKANAGEGRRWQRVFALFGINIL